MTIFCIILLGLLLLNYIVKDYEPPEFAEKPIPPGADWDFHSDGQTIITVNPRKGENLPRS